MEPAAPGTEDDEKPIVSANLNKKENEQERLLALRAPLLNGKYSNVFELSYQNGSEQWYCNLCTCPIMGRVYYHEIGKRHTNNMQQAAGSYKKYGEANLETTLQIAPGQPIPPGFEGMVEKIAQIQDRLNGFTVGPLIGLEYLFELQEYDRDKEPSYLCLLCDKRGDPRTVIAHLASYNHISQYLQRHFISCFRALSPYITKQYKRNWQGTMQKIAEAVETKFGRLKPHVVDRELFDAQRSYYQNSVANGPHFNEKSGITFEELVDKEQITKLVSDEVSIIKISEDISKRTYRKTGTDPHYSESVKNLKRSPSPPVVARPKKPKPCTATSEKRRSLSSVSSISSSDLSDFDPGTKAPPRGEEKLKRGEEKFRKTVPVVNKEKNYFQRREPEPSPYRGRLLPWQRSDYIRSRSDMSVDRGKEKIDKLEEFRKLANAIENDMDRILKQHEKNPEKHPQYNEEWKKFWNKRYKELQGEGKDASTYDFKPDWIEFWNKKMIEIHHGEVKLKKDALRKRLGLQEEPLPISFKISGRRKPGHREDSKPAPIASTPDCDPDVIIIEDKDEESISSKRSHSPWESESESISHKSREKSLERSRERRRFSRERDRPRKSPERSREKLRTSRDRSRERMRRSRDRSRERMRISRDRSRERSYQRKERDRSRSRTPDKRRIREHEFSRDKVYYRESAYKNLEYPEYIKPPRVMRDVTRHPVHSPPPAPFPQAPLEKEVIFDEDEEVNIVSVLRLLTALEEKLGSLGPKVIDLLGQALALEKNEANSAESLLDNEINCVLFETVKEKLKGQLLAGLVSYNQEKAFKYGIKKIASLIHFAGERGKEKERNKPKVDPIIVPGVGTVDKAAIAKQIATALINQGKTDVTQAELEQLINAVVGMAEASRNSDKPMTTANFLEQLSTQKVVENKSKPPEGSLVSALTASTVEEEAPSNSKSNMDGLSDADLQTLLQNFKDLVNDEQHSLISYLKKLESKEPERVERLRKFVNLDANASNSECDKNEKSETKVEIESGRSSPFSSRIAGHNPTEEDDFKEGEELKIEKLGKVIDSEDEEEYSFEDVFKVAKQNVTEKEENDKKIAATVAKSDDFDLSMAKSLIANIMGQLKTKKEKTPPPLNLLGLGNIDKPESFIDKLPANLTNLTDAINAVNHQFNKPNYGNDFNLQSNTGANEIALNLNIGPSRSNMNLNRPNPNMFQNRPNIVPPPNLNVMRQMAPNRLGQPSNTNQMYPNLGQNYSNAQNFPTQSRPNIGMPQNDPNQSGNYSPNVSYPLLNQFRNNQQFREQQFNRPDFPPNHNLNPNNQNNRPRSNQFDSYGSGW